MDGFSATAELRRLEADGRRVPIIALTASALVADRVRCLAAGMDDYLSKPVKAAELEFTLGRWINIATSAAEVESAAAVAGSDGDSVSRRLDELRGAGTEPEQALVRQLIASFLAQAPGFLSAVTDAVTAADLAALDDQAHGFKGVAANIGATRIAEICQRLESFGRAGRVDPSAIQDVHRLRAELSHLQGQLRSLVG
jgi:CheY-like chemotaxis protein